MESESFVPPGRKIVFVNRGAGACEDRNRRLKTGYCQGFAKGDRLNLEDKDSPL